MKAIITESYGKIVKKVVPTEEEVLACPFCGNTALEITSKESYTKLTQENGKACIILTCHNCDTAKTCFEDVESYEEKVNILVSNWNKRTK